MDTPTETLPVLTPVTKPKKPMSEAQLESLARAREKAMEVRKAKAAAKKAEAENPPELEPVFHGEDPPEPPKPVKPTAPELSPPKPQRQPAQNSDSSSDDEEARIAALVQAGIKKARKKDKAKREAKRVRYVVEESESEEEGEVVLVRKKSKTTPPHVPVHPPPANPFHAVYPRPSAFRRY